VADEPAVDAVAAQLLQARGEARTRFERDAELLVLLLADPAGAVVHGDADPAARRCVFAPPPCQRLPCQTSTLPFGISAGIES
jgi:hypothetical protein